MKTYFDTSYLVALYIPNDHTSAALRHRKRTGRQALLFTPLHRLELRTAIRQCAYSRLVTESGARQALRDIDDDLLDGTLIHQPVNWTDSLRAAETVAERVAWTKSCRSLDLWHVAVALESHADAFVTFDHDQLVLAQSERLHTVLPP